MKTGLLHVRTNVKNLEKAIDWYTKTLRFKVTATWPPEKPNYAHFESEEGTTFAIMEEEHVASHGRFNFYVEDVEAL